MTASSEFRKDLGIQTKLELIPVHNSARAKFTSKKMYNDLIKLGCTTKKSLALKAPKSIPKRLIPHTIRGYFDGDGCIGFLGGKARVYKQPHITIVGTFEFLTWMQKHITIPTNIYKMGKNSKNTYRLVIGKQADVREMYKYLYKDSMISLSRKKQKFQEVIKDLKGRK